MQRESRNFAALHTTEFHGFADMMLGLYSYYVHVTKYTHTEYAIRLSATRTAISERQTMV